jgi:UTP-glucose-1-phosphate uridylyltransferase
MKNELEYLVSTSKNKQPNEFTNKLYSISFNHLMSETTDCCKQLIKYYDQIEKGFIKINDVKDENKLDIVSPRPRETNTNIF